MTRLIPLLVLALAACSDEAPDTGAPGTTPPVALDRSDTEVSFPGAAHDLEGVLTLPDRVEGQPVPAVLLVHGSGPLSRDSALGGQLNMGFGFEVTVFADLADDLAAEGYAVLRYDKRSCFAGNGCDNDYPTPSSDLLVTDFLADADAALDWLGAHPEIDPDRLVVAGHSQGGHLVSHLLADNPSVHAGVMLSGGHRPIDGLIGFQLDSSEALLLELGYGQDVVDDALADLQILVDGLAEVRGGTYTAPLLGGVPAAFWEDWMALDDASPGLAATVDQPILALGGDYDWNVPPEEAEAWGALLEPLGKGHRAVVLPCVTHALNCISEPDWLQIGVDDLGTEVDPAVAAEIVDFLDAL